MNLLYRQRRVLALCAAVTLVATGCSKPAVEADADAVAALNVKVQAPTVGDLAQSAAYTGRVMPDESVYIIPKIPGEVTGAYFEVGDTVNAGDLLFEVDATEIELAVRQAEAGVQAVNATITATMGSGYESQLIQAESALKQSQSAEKWTTKSYDDYDDTFNASTNTLRNAVRQTRTGVDALGNVYTNVRKLASVDRDATDSGFGSARGRIRLPNELADALRTLNRTGLTSVYPDADNTIDAGAVYILEGEYSEAKASLKALERQYEDASNSYDAQQNQLNQGLDQVTIGSDAAQKAYDLVASGRALNEQLAVYQAQLDQARLGYESAMQKLSYTKVTTPISGVVEQKNVEINGMATQSGPAYVISNKGTLTVNFNVSALAVEALQLGDLVTVEAGARTLSARVVEVGNAINPQSGLFTVKAQLEGDTTGLLTGMSVKLTANTSKATGAMLVPTSCIYYDKGNPYVYVARDGVATRVPIETGLISNDLAEVRAGLTAADQIITSWNPNLNDGVAIEIGQEG